MKRLIVITGIILLVYLVLMTQTARPVTAPQSAADSAARTTVESGYRIGVSEGNVAVFRDGKLCMRTDTPLSSLPKSDRARLEEGVYIDSVKELKERLEDYCS